METTNDFILKVSRLFNSSCHFRTLLDVQEPHPHQNRHRCSSSSSSNSFIPNKINLCTSKTMHSFAKSCRPNINLLSYSGTATCFSTTTASDTFFSLSSNSGDSFRFKSQMKRIDDQRGSRSFSSVNSFNAASVAKCSSRKTVPTSNDDQISAELYYGGGSDRHHSSFRRRKSKRNTTTSSSSSSRRRRRRRRRRRTRSFEWNEMIEETYAVEKKSRDPPGDFRASMVEMIVEKQMFGAGDLERLLQCFLSLNSESYHGIIIQVFTEICETLFTN